MRVDELNSEYIPTMTKKKKIVKNNRARTKEKNNKKPLSPHRLLLTHSSFGLFDSVNTATNYTRSVELKLVFSTIYYVFLFSLSLMHEGFSYFSKLQCLMLQYDPPPPSIKLNRMQFPQLPNRRGQKATGAQYTHYGHNIT